MQYYLISYLQTLALSRMTAHWHLLTLKKSTKSAGFAISRKPGLPKNISIEDSLIAVSQSATLGIL